MVFEKEEKTKKGRAPDFSANKEGIQVWKNKDKNGNAYLSIKIPLLNISVNCFEVKTKE